MNCNVYVFYKLLFSNKFGFILDTVFSYKTKTPLMSYTFVQQSKIK